jgi:hypothetical protein
MRQYLKDVLIWRRLNASLKIVETVEKILLKMRKVDMYANER